MDLLNNFACPSLWSFLPNYLLPSENLLSYFSTPNHLSLISIICARVFTPDEGRRPDSLNGGASGLTPRPSFSVQCLSGRKWARTSHWCPETPLSQSLWFLTLSTPCAIPLHLVPFHQTRAKYISPCINSSSSRGVARVTITPQHHASIFLSWFTLQAFGEWTMDTV